MGTSAVAAEEPKYVVCAASAAAACGAADAGARLSRGAPLASVRGSRRADRSPAGLGAGAGANSTGTGTHELPFFFPPLVPDCASVCAGADVTAGAGACVAAGCCCACASSDGQLWTSTVCVALTAPTGSGEARAHAMEAGEATLAPGVVLGGLGGGRVAHGALQASKEQSHNAPISTTARVGAKARI